MQVAASGCRKIADSTGAELTGGDTLLRSLILRRLLRGVLSAATSNIVGLLLPPSVPGFLANMALALDRRITANLNYTVSSDVMNACIEQAGIKHVITSRKFMDKMNFKLNAELVYLEDFKDKPTAADKAIGYLAEPRSAGRYAGDVSSAWRSVKPTMC